jgi:histidinol phosphatase-like enzyme
VTTFFDLLLSRHCWPTFAFFRHKLRSTKFTRGLIFLDLDGTMWPDLGPGGILSLPNPSEFLAKKFPNAMDRRGSRKVVFVTNQTHFARQDIYNLKDLKSYFIKMNQIRRSLNCLCLLVCHHHPNALNPKLRLKCAYRKPSGLIIERLFESISFDKEHSIFIGDRITDMITAEEAGIGQSLLIINHKMFELNDNNYRTDGAHAFFSIIPKFDGAFLELIESKNV